jgi:hypothetical protein
MSTDRYFLHHNQASIATRKSNFSPRKKTAALSGVGGGGDQVIKKRENEALVFLPEANCP